MTRPTYGRPRALTAEQAAELRKWAEFGRSISAVARRYGVATNTIRAYLRGERKQERAA
jgi:transposase